MNIKKAGRHLKVPIIFLVLLILFIIYFLLFTPVSPLKGDLRANPSINPIPADGFWGAIGFYERQADNNLTYFLMLTFTLMTVNKIIRQIKLFKSNISILKKNK